MYKRSGDVQLGYSLLIVQLLQILNIQVSESVKNEERTKYEDNNAAEACVVYCSTCHFVPFN